MSSLSALRRRRGVVRASITKLDSRLTELEASLDRDEVARHTQRLSTRLNTLDSEFKTHHYEVISAIDEDDDAAQADEQAIIDKHDEDVDALTVRIESLLATSVSPAVSEERKLLLRRLQHIKKTLRDTCTDIDGLPPDTEDIALIQAYEEEVLSLKEQIATCYKELSSIELESEDELLVLYSEIKKIQFDCCHKVKRMLCPRDTTHGSVAAPSTESKGLKVPKLEAPTFDGNILNWTHFWEQFVISIDSKSDLTDAEKFVYLQNAIKGGSAKNVIEGLWWNW